MPPSPDADDNELDAQIEYLRALARDHPGDGGALAETAGPRRVRHLGAVAIRLPGIRGALVHPR
jgi:hypothetical protein